ncbi:MAG: hypothetical protein HOM11_05430 [Methylococcales bacterium]|nr:hypothetical protein [Methylococcales bacterium]MBT7442548.1 hypothetical protein [Methylococcales bacterium]
MTKKVARKKIWINKRLQSQIALHLAVFFALCCLVVFIDYTIFEELLRAQQISNEIGKFNGQTSAHSDFIILATTYGVALLVLNLSFFYGLSLYISHRIAGPIVNITQRIQDLQEGKLTARVHLRKGDYLIDIETSINELAETLQHDIREIKQHPEHAQAQLDQYKTAE